MVPAWRLRLFYFLYYGNVGTYMPYFAPYLLGLGFSGKQAGAVQMIPSLVGPFVAIAWTGWADRRSTATRALRLASLVSIAAAVLLPVARTPAAIGAVILAQALGERAVIPLADSVSIEWARSDPAYPYTRIRLAGSLGFIVLANAVGLALTARGGRPGDLLVPLAVAACVAGYALAARALPPTPVHAGPRPALREMAALLRERRLLVFLVASALHWAAGAPYNFLFGVLVRDRGFSQDVTGLGMGAGVVAEVAMLLLYPRLERALALRTLLAVAFAGSAVRWLLVAGATSPDALVLLQLLHGLTFGLFWGAAVNAMARFVPPRLRATGQGLFSATVFGVVNTAAYLAAGAGYDAYRSAAPLFAWAAAIELLPLALALVALRPPRSATG